MAYSPHPDYDLSPLAPLRRHTSTSSAHTIASSSPPTAVSPISNPMVRKRTLQDMTLSPDYDHSGALSSSPQSSIPSFEFEPAQPADSSTSSPYTLASSPMSHSHSSQSSFSLFGEGSSVGGDDDEDMSPQEDEDLLHARQRRPEMKRRRTAPDIMALRTPTREDRVSYPSSMDKKGNGKDGQDVWPSDVEEAFHTALQIIPKLGRKKVMVHGKPCGRNELIADYIRRKTGKVRSRKQVSSHIQVLKNIRKNDVDFMNLVSEPLEGEDCFAPGAALAFFGISPNGSTGGSDALLSPYSSSFLQRSMSVGSASSVTSSIGSSIPPSPALSDSSAFQSGRLGVSTPMSATSSLTSAMKDLHFPIPAKSTSSPTSCPIAPAAFCLWADDGSSDSMHVFAELEGGGAGPKDTVVLEDISTSEREFPSLADMFDHLPCQFLHVSLNLDIPILDGEHVATQLHTQLNLTSLQDLNLTSVTRIYSFGHEVLSLQEQLDKPTRISPPSNSSLLSSPMASSDSPSSDSPFSTPSSKAPISLGHKYSYNAPFASDFWSIFLRGAFSSEGGKMLPSFAKAGDERAAFVMAISGLSVIQEFVVCSDDSSSPLVDGKDVSAGSALGDVVLVVTYSFECNEDDASFGKADVSYLTVSGPSTSPAPRVIAQSPRIIPTVIASPPAPPTPTRNDILRPGLPLRSPARGRSSIPSPSKPNLSLRIPSPAQFTQVAVAGLEGISPSNNPITPWPQMIHTPLAPPPVLQPGPPPPGGARDDRLERIWARNSHDWELDSPALIGAFPGSAVDIHQPRRDRQHSAMADMTTQAMAAGTPLLAGFPVSTHGAPFIHPSHNYSVKDEEMSDDDGFSRFLSDEAVADDEDATVYGRNMGEMDGVHIKEEPKSPVDIQDYFTGLLGSSTRYVGGQKKPATPKKASTS